MIYYTSPLSLNMPALHTWSQSSYPCRNCGSLYETSGASSNCKCREIGLHKFHCNKCGTVFTNSSDARRCNCQTSTSGTVSKNTCKCSEFENKIRDIETKLEKLMVIQDTRKDLDIAQDQLRIFQENGDRQGKANSLENLGLIVKKRGDLAEAERLHRESLAIRREIGDRQGEASSLINLGIIMNSKGQHDEERRMYTSAVRIQRKIGIPVQQWFIDNGY
jgi:tetratricopeptide (TPR) repeat protein